MKKMSFLPMLFLSVMLNVKSSTAQYSQKQLSNDSVFLHAAATLVESEADRSALANLKEINGKASRDFVKHFSNASEIAISNQGKRIFIGFRMHGIKSRIQYNSKGKREWHLRFLNENQIPKSVAQLVQHAYPEYSIFNQTTEVNVWGRTAYLVLIENCNSWKRVRVVNGEVDVFEEYRKLPAP